MSKKKKSKKKVDKVDTKSTDSKVDKKDKQSTVYKRGSLGKAIFAQFDKVGVDNIVYDDCLKLAKSILQTTKFDKYHFSWYKNKYRQNQ